jgi:hypothetical protein
MHVELAIDMYHAFFITLFVKRKLHIAQRVAESIRLQKLWLSKQINGRQQATEYI